MRRNVQRHPDVRADVTLEGEGLGVGDIHTPVHRHLKRSGVGHDEAVKVKDVVQTAFQCLLPELLAFGEDVGVGDNSLNTHLLHLRGRDDLQVRVDDRQQCRSSDCFVADLQFADASCDVFVDYFKIYAHARLSPFGKDGYCLAGGILNLGLIQKEYAGLITPRYCCCGSISSVFGNHFSTEIHLVETTHNSSV